MVLWLIKIPVQCPDLGNPRNGLCFSTWRDKFASFLRLGSMVWDKGAERWRNDLMISGQSGEKSGVCGLCSLLMWHSILKAKAGSCLWWSSWYSCIWTGGESEFYHMQSLCITETNTPVKGLTTSSGFKVLCHKLAKGLTFFIMTRLPFIWKQF